MSVILPSVTEPPVIFLLRFPEMSRNSSVYSWKMGVVQAKQKTKIKYQKHAKNNQQKNKWGISCNSCIPWHTVIFNDLKPPYRSRQYYESKLLHMTEVNWFSTAHSSLKKIVLVKSLTECLSHIQYASFHTLKAKIGRLFFPK